MAIEKSAVPLTGAALEKHREEVRKDILSRGKKVWSRKKDVPRKKKEVHGKVAHRTTGHG